MLVKAQTVFELTLGRYTAHAAHAKTKIKIIKRTKLLGNCLILVSLPSYLAGPVWPVNIGIL